MRVEILWIPAFAGMTEEIDGFDESNPYLFIETRNLQLVTCILTG
jgi:hypothetical protein